MMVDYVRTLYAYNTWANERVLDAAARLNPAQLVADGGASFGSVRDTLVHLVSAQRVWLDRCRHLPTPQALQPGDFPDVAALRSAWERIDEEMRTFVASVDEAALSSMVRYINSAGVPNAYMLWQVLIHQANHAMQHRSEVAMLLTSYGFSPGLLDFLYYLDQSGQQA